MATTSSLEYGPSRILRTFLAIGVGNALDWYDWNMFATYAPAFGGQFFRGSHSEAILNSFMLFAIGFLFRPLGAVFMGRYADKYGRKKSMLISIIISGVSLLVISAIPSVEHIGVVAPIILYAMRIMQGIAHGGELPVAQTYIAEKAPDNHQGLWSSWIYISGTIGNATGTVIYLLVSTLMTHNQVQLYGWRIAFAFGGICALLSIFLRAGLVESEAFLEHEGEEKILAYPRSTFYVFIVSVGFTVTYYMWAIAAPSYAQVILHITPVSASLGSLIAQLIFIIALGLWGLLSDKIGYRRLIVGCSIALVVCVFPLQMMMSISRAEVFFPAQSVALIILAIFGALLPVVFADIFPVGNRVSGVALPYSLATGLFGGTAPYIAVLTSQHHCYILFTVYMFFLLLAGLICIITVPVKSYLIHK